MNSQSNETSFGIAFLKLKLKKKRYVIYLIRPEPSKWISQRSQVYRCVLDEILCMN